VVNAWQILTVQVEIVYQENALVFVILLLFKLICKKFNIYYIANQIGGQCLTNTDCTSSNCISGKCSGIYIF